MQDLETMARTLQGVYSHWGFLLVFAGALAESVVVIGLVLPGGLLVIVGAVYAAQGLLPLPVVALLGWLGIMVGTSLDYLFGRYAANAALRRLPLSGLITPRLQAARQRLERYGIWAPIVAHVLGHPRAYVAMAAGMGHRPYAGFLRHEAVAALVWTAIFVTGGYVLSSNLALLKALMGGAGFLIVFALISLFVGRRLLAQARLPRGVRTQQ